MEAFSMKAHGEQRLSRSQVNRAGAKPQGWFPSGRPGPRPGSARGAQPAPERRRVRPALPGHGLARATQNSSCSIKMRNSLALGLMTIFNWSGYENLIELLYITPVMAEQRVNQDN